MTHVSTGSAPLIAIVGVCASGKSTLAKALRERGYNARQVLQEHSYVPYMWQRITRPTCRCIRQHSGGWICAASTWS